jgi:hypothetical protein
MSGNVRYLFPVLMNHHLMNHHLMNHQKMMDGDGDGSNGEEGSLFG